MDTLGNYSKLLNLQVDGSYLCPNCNLPMCEEMCAFGEEHTKECQIFEKLSPKLSIDDLNNSNSIYWCITALRLLTLRDSEPTKYEIAKRMMVMTLTNLELVVRWRCVTVLRHHTVSIFLIALLRHRCITV